VTRTRSRTSPEKASPPPTSKPTAPTTDIAPEPVGRWARVLIAVPDATILLFLCVVVAVGPLAAFGQFRKLAVAAVFVLALLVARRAMPEAMPAVRSSAIWSALAVLLAVAFVLVNLPYASQYYVVVRDPAVYTVRAIRMTGHASPNIPVTEAVNGARGISGSYTDTSGFFQVGNHWEPQGSSLVPGVFAIGGWIAGESGVLAADIVVAGMALLTIYALGRRLLGPAWALVPMAAMATSLPTIAFGRGAYTELTALILGLGGIVLLRSALTARRALPAVASGVALGATFLARVDGLLFVLGATAALGLAAGVSRSERRRVQLRHSLLWFLLGASASLVLAFVDLARNSSVYEMTSWGQIKPLTELTIAVAVTAVLAGFVPSFSPRLGRLGLKLTDSGRRWAPRVAGGMLVLFLALAFRPLYYVAHAQGRGTDAIAVRQAAANLPVDGTRTYDENTVSWLAWYFSWPVVLLGAVGVALLLVRAWRRRDAWLASILSILGGACLVYLNRSSITPDQVWAMRRFLPIVIPLGLIAAASVLPVICRRYPRWRVVVVVVGVLIATVPVITWPGVFRVTQYGGARSFVNSVCARVGHDHVILADDSDGGRIFLPTLRVSCGVEAVLLSESSPQSMLAVRDNWADGVPITVIAFVPDAIPWASTAHQPAVVGSFTVWQEPLTTRPKGSEIRIVSAYIGDLQPDGLVRPRS
jgi:hypothetical protein